MRPEICNLLSRVQKPYRLAGGEAGSRLKPWDKASVRVCLAFPDTYEIGMSHVGLAILYDIVNGHPEFLAERVFAPWKDVEDELRGGDIPLFSLESQRSLNDFDVIGITLPYELTYTNILNMLDLARIPFRSEERGDDHPLIVGGGSCAFNPEPVADFFDAIVLGDGEDVIVEIANEVKKYKEVGLSKEELLECLSKIRGIYVPQKCGVRGTEYGVKKAIMSDIDSAQFPSAPVVAHSSIQDRAAVEIQRGCVHGCRFCQAGMVYRPLRQRSPEKVLDLVMSSLSESGYEQVSLMSLSVGDYSCLNDILGKLSEQRKRMPFAVGLPSLRTEFLNDDVLENLGDGRSGSFTLAPEAATERMRAFINKSNTDDDLFASVEKVFQNGWSKIKLYFMVGLPGETKEEIDGIKRVANRCLDIGRKYHKRPDVTVSTSTFVPKPHTPLQWSRQISREEALEIQRYLKKNLRRPGLYYRWHDAGMSMLEGVLCRGGRELDRAIERAFREGARFDGWDESFDFELWGRAFEREEIVPKKYLGERRADEALPWDHLYADLKKDFLLKEYERARNGTFTPSCVTGPCQDCGVCDFDRVKNRMYGLTPVPGCHSEGGTTEESLAFKKLKARDPSLRPSPYGAWSSLRMTSKARDSSTEPALSEPFDYAQDKLRESNGLGMTSNRIRIRFSKLGRAAYLGHLELTDAIKRTIRAAGLPLEYTQGFHPRPKISLGRALPVGMESECEYVDVYLVSIVDADEVRTRLGNVAQEGLEFEEVQMLDDDVPSLDHGIVQTRYEVAMDAVDGISDAIHRFSSLVSCPVTVMRRQKGRSIDLKHAVTGLAVRDDNVVELALSHANPSVKATEALGAIFGLNEEQVKSLRIRKVDVSFRPSE